MSENLRAPLDHACGLARQGVRVFPCKNIPADPAQHKAPLTIRGFRDASTDAAVIRAWWQCWREALVGAVAEKFCAVDVDLQHEGVRMHGSTSTATRSPLPGPIGHRAEDSTSSSAPMLRSDARLAPSPRILIPGDSTRAM